MAQHRFIKVLGKAFKYYAGISLLVLLFQLVGLVIYTINFWPGVRENLSDGVSYFISAAVFLMFIRSFLWIQIYWSGARTFSILHREGDSPKLANSLSPILKTLTRLLVVSCIIDLCFVPVIFMYDKLIPFSVSGYWLGYIDLTILFFPQAFGIGALILAFLTYHYRQLLIERSQLKEEIELIV
jgi:hypothetical protein